MNKRILQLFVVVLAVIMMPLTMQAQELPPCLDGIENMEFESPDEFIAYVEANCDSTIVDDMFGGFPGGGDATGGGFPGGGPGGGPGDFALPCLDGAEDMEFETEDEFIAYLYANCDSLLIDSLFWVFGEGDWEWSEEDEMQYLAETYADCIGDEAFADLDAMWIFIEENCFDFPGDWEGEWDGEWTEESEMDFLTQIYAECLGDEAFADLEAMLDFIEDNCNDYAGDWDGSDDYDCGDFDWTEEDEMALLAEEFSDCIGDQAFADLDAMWNFILEICENDFPGDGGVIIIDGDGDEIDAECLVGLSQDFATFQEMLLFLESTCGDSFGMELPDCFLNAPIFDNDEDFFQYLDANCGDVFDGQDGGQEFSEDDMGALIASYNLSGANAATNEEQGALGIEAIDGVNMTMFPNPTTDFVQLNITEDFIQDYQLYDITGRLVDTATNLDAETITIDLEELNVGTYFVKVSTENGKTYSNAIIVR